MKALDRDMETGIALPPPGWSYNPSSWSDRAWLIAVAAIGFVISGYLALYQWNVIGAVFHPPTHRGSEVASMLGQLIAAVCGLWLMIAAGLLG